MMKLAVKLQPPCRSSLNREVAVRCCRRRETTKNTQIQAETWFLLWFYYTKQIIEQILNIFLQMFLFCFFTGVSVQVSVELPVHLSVAKAKLTMNWVLLKLSSHLIKIYNLIKVDLIQDGCQSKVISATTKKCLSVSQIVW